MINKNLKIDQKLKNELEFNKIIKILNENSKSEFNKIRINNIEVYKDEKEINYHLNCLDEFKFIKSFNEYPRFKYIDLSDCIKLLKISNSILSKDQIFNIYDAVDWANSFLYVLKKLNFDFQNLKILTKDIFINKNIIKSINNIFTSKRILKDKASEKLFKLRKSIQKLRKKITIIFNSQKKIYKQKGFLSDIEESFYEGIMVLAISSEYKRKIKGINRRQSKSGSISFIEPSGCVEYNRDLAILLDEENKEIKKIYSKITNDFSNQIYDIINFNFLIEEIDFLTAKNKLSELINGVKPIINLSKNVKILDALHPILAIENKKKKIETVSQKIEINDKERLIVISGPNAGGKSVTLKTFGILQLMIQSGLFVPVNSKSKFTIYDSIYTDIGDNQSIENELSTYSYRLKKMNQILNKANSNSFVLIDEFGSGSDPILGGELASIFFQELIKLKSQIILTTHYGKIKVMADNNVNSINASMQFDENKLKPLYKLNLGHPGSSFTLEVAKNVGIPEYIIKKVKKSINNKVIKLEDTIKNYHFKALEFEKRKKLLDNSESKLLKKNNLLDDKIKLINQKINHQKKNNELDNKYKQLGEKVSKLITIYKNGKSIKKINIEFKKLIEKELNKKKSERAILKKTDKKYSFKIGDNVKIKNSNQVGRITEIDKQSAKLQIGYANLKVDFSNLKLQTKNNR